MATQLASAPSGEKGDGNAHIQAQPVGASPSSSGRPAPDPNLVSLLRGSRLSLYKGNNLEI
jgi:hypothetical protein